MTNSQHENVRTLTSVVALISVMAAVFISWGTIRSRLDNTIQIMEDIRTTQTISAESIRQIDSRVSFLEGYIRSEERKFQTKTQGGG